MIKKLAILGSTGSIGRQTLEIVSKNPDLLSVELLTAGNNADSLIEQALKFCPKKVVIANEMLYDKVKSALSSTKVEVYSGSKIIEDLVKCPEIDTVVAAIVGAAGLKPTFSAVEAGKNIALANKETLVVAGGLLNAAQMSQIYPVDSEHSAIWQCLRGEEGNKIEKILLTGSGGPFRTFSKNDLNNVTKEMALKHPNWAMGAKITIDSATLMNKGLEVIEAKWLFDVDFSQIEVIIHPQSVIHSMIQFRDGSVKAQMGLPDMKLPIQYAIFYPQRIDTSFKRLNFFEHNNLSFEKPNLENFPCLELALEAGRQGGNQPCVMNAANEMAVHAFLNDKIRFVDIPKVIEKAVSTIPKIVNPSLEDLLASDAETRLLKDSTQK